MTWHTDFIAKCLSSDYPINDALAYNVRIMPIATSLGQQYYRVLGIHHLTPEENRGNRHLFCDVLDERGERIYNQRLQVQNNNIVTQIVIDKPLNEPGSNAPMVFGDTLNIWCLGLNSESGVGFNTRYPDEAPGNTLGHHSFYIVFERVTDTGTPGPDPEPPDPPQPVPGLPPEAWEELDAWIEKWRI